MKKKGFYLLILLFFFFSASAFDTLEVLQEFDSPIPEPRALEFDGTNFWLSNLHTPKLYRLDKNIQIVDSIALPFARIAGITFKESETWIVRDSVVAESLVVTSGGDSLYYNVYCIYKLSNNKSSVLDSVRIKASATNSQDTNHLWGITFFNNHFYASYNGGWGPCIYKINPVTKEVNYLMGHASGMSTINGEWWGIGGVGNEPYGSYLMTMQESGTETIIHDVLFNPTDLTFDGSNIWLCDCKNSKICKMGSSVSIEAKHVIAGSTSLKQQGRKVVIFDVKGRMVASDNITRNLPNGAYYIKVPTNNGSLFRKMVIVK